MSDTKSFTRKYILPDEDFFIAMRTTGLVAPILLTIAILSVYIGYWYPPGFQPTPPDYAGLKALLSGTFLGLLGWIFIGLVIKHSVTIDRANPAVYRELYSRFKIVEDQVNYLIKHLDKKYKESQEKGAPAQHDETFANLAILSAKQEVNAYLKRLQEVLDDEEVLNDEQSEQKNHGIPRQLAPGSPPSVLENGTPGQGQRNPPIKNPRIQNWLEGSGYITAWGELHRVEEALIMLSPLETVIADGYSDKQCLNGSNIAAFETLKTRLDTHLKILEARLRKEPIGEPPLPPSAIEEVLARTESRYVRNAINEFRDHQRRGLIQARNRLLKTVGMTGLVGLLLVMLAVLMHVPPMNLVTASAFYLVGAIMGLFNQLYLDGSSQEATEDYGLATARLIHTPIISGLAALGGVLIIPMLSFSVTGSTGDPSKLHVDYLLDLTQQPFSVVLAAIFGLSPVVLLRRLQREAEQYKTGLQGTESRTGPAQPGSRQAPPSPTSTTYGSPP